MVAWRFWYLRNQMVFEQKMISLEEAINQALALLEDFKLSMLSNSKPATHNLSWLAPETNTMKLNVDGAIFWEFYRSGISYVLRNSNGEVLMAATKLEQQSSDPLEVEFMAIFHGLQLCVPLGFPKSVSKVILNYIFKLLWEEKALLPIMQPLFEKSLV